MKENWEINWKDYYKTLQVDPAAEPEVVKAAFERLARKYHPDVNKDPSATQRMMDINEAYEILGDTEKRKRYYLVYLLQTNMNGNRENSPPPPPSSTSSSPPSASSAKSRAHNRAFNSVCQRCGKPKRVVFAHYNKNIGMGFSRQEQSIKGYFCAKCVRILFLQYFFTCLGLGWFGVVSFATNPFRLMFDAFQYVRSEIRLGGLGKTVIYSCLVGVVVFCSILVFTPKKVTNSSNGSLLSIVLTPHVQANLVVGYTQQFIATGTYSDGSTLDITPYVTWTSNNNAIAPIDSNGLVTCLAAGTTNITATKSGITSPTVSLTVVAATLTTSETPTSTGILTSISISPDSPPILAVGSTEQFIATGEYSDGTTNDITSTVIWDSDDPSVATISYNGLATGMSMDLSMLRHH